MPRYIDNVILNEIRAETPLDGINQKTIANFDICFFHSSNRLFIRKIEKSQHSAHICSSRLFGKLQPKDVAVNYDHKEMLKGGFTNGRPPKILSL